MRAIITNPYVIMLVSYILISYLLVDVVFPYWLISKSVRKKQYYKPYDVLSDEGCTGTIKRDYISKYEQQIYDENLSNNFQWLNLDKQQLEEFFKDNNVCNLKDKFIILEMCNYQLGYEYDLSIILHKNRCNFCRVEKLIMLNQSLDKSETVE